MQETQVQSLDWEDPLEKGMAIHSNILAWRIPYGQRSLVGFSPWSCDRVTFTSYTNIWHDTSQEVVGPRRLQILPCLLVTT